jgi:hypothetical protein
MTSTSKGAVVARASTRQALRDDLASAVFVTDRSIQHGNWKAASGASKDAIGQSGMTSSIYRRPANDPRQGEAKYVASIAFTDDGYLVSRRSVTYRGGAESLQARLRPAMAAAKVRYRARCLVL